MQRWTTDWNVKRNITEKFRYVPVIIGVRCRKTNKNKLITGSLWKIINDPEKSENRDVHFWQTGTLGLQKSLILTLILNIFLQKIVNKNISKNNRVHAGHNKALEN